VVELVRDTITSTTNRNNPISSEITCLATLRYLATGKMQLCNADALGILQTSVGRAINQTINTLSRPHFIQQFNRLPLDNQQLYRIKANFMASQVCPVWSVLLMGRTSKSLRHEQIRTFWSIERKSTPSTHRLFLIKILPFLMLLQCGLDLP
jgi:hypothetical protein